MHRAVLSPYVAGGIASEPSRSLEAMGPEFTSERLKCLFKDGGLIFPPMTSEELGDVGKVIAEVGLPKNFGGFFKPVERIDLDCEIKKTSMLLGMRSIEPRALCRSG